MSRIRKSLIVSLAIVFSGCNAQRTPYDPLSCLLVALSKS
jgi:hypothetical protein